MMNDRESGKLPTAEAASLTWGDVDLARGTVTVKTARSLATDLQALAARIVARLPDDGPVLGLRGLCIDLEEVETLARKIRLRATHPQSGPKE